MSDEFKIAIAPGNILVEPVGISVPAGKTEQISVMLEMDDGTLSEATETSVYSSSNIAIAIVSVTGLVQGLSVGSTFITVSNSGLTREVPVEVTEAIMDSISTSVQEIELPKGRTELVTVTANMSDGTVVDITTLATLSINDPEIATISGNRITLAKVGSATVTVSYNSLTAVITVIVLDPVIDSIASDAGATTLPIGHQRQLIITATKSDGSTENLTNFVTYNSTDYAVLNVSNIGLISAVGEGTAAIIVNYEDKQITIPMAVTPAIIDEVTVTIDKSTIVAGTFAQLVVRCKYSDGRISDITREALYNSSSVSITTISNTGVVKGVATGNATITATYNNVSGTIPIVVTPAIPVELIIAPDVSIIYINKSVQYKASVIYSDQSIVEVTNTATWVSSVEGIVTIEGGQIIGLVVGATNITVVYNGLSKVIHINVVKAGSFKLTIDRCTDVDVKGYRIMRRSKFNAFPIKVMEVLQPENINPITITNEKLIYRDNKWYSLHGNILSDRAIAVKVNDVDVTDFEIDLKNGIFTITAGERDIVKASYTFDGVNALDCSVLQPGVIYYGPEPIDDSQLLPPINTTIESNGITGQLIVKFDEPPDMGTDYYFSWIAFDKSGNESVPSDEVAGRIMQLHPETPYKLEKLDDNGDWGLVKYNNQRVFTDEPGNLNPEPVSNLDVDVTSLDGQGLINVQLRWNAVTLDRLAQSSQYRVKLVNSAGQESLPGAAVGPVTVHCGVSKIVIRRKVYENDNVFPSFDNPDAITAAEIIEDSIVYNDMGLEDLTIYAYSIFTVDTSGKHSMPTTIIAEVGDITPPEQVVIENVKSLPL